MNTLNIGQNWPEYKRGPSALAEGSGKIQSRSGYTDWKKRAKDITAQHEEAKIPAEIRSQDTNNTNEKINDPISMVYPFLTLPQSPLRVLRHRSFLLRATRDATFSLNLVLKLGAKVTPVQMALYSNILEDLREFWHSSL